MLEQIERDFCTVAKRKVGLAALEKTYQQTLSVPFYRYRIVHNRLHKFIPDGHPFSSRDSRLEKAFKTLLIYAKVPDVEFILCPMDGIPEPYMPPHFFLVEDKNLQAPILAQAKRKDPSTQSIILIPDQFSLSAEWKEITQEICEENSRIGWQDKKNTLLWRGGLTDAGMPNALVGNNYVSSPRYLLCKLSLTYPELIDAGVNWAATDTQSFLRQEGVVKEALSRKEHLLYKYLPVLDGHMCTYPGYQWRLLSYSVCLKQESDQAQWFYAALHPYIHYIPVKNDLRDILDVIQWARLHDHKAHEIAQNSHTFALNNLLLEDNYLYLYLVLKKLASLQECDSSQLCYHTKTDPHWKCIQFRNRNAFFKSLRKTMRHLRNCL